MKSLTMLALAGMTKFAPLVWRRLYASTYMFPPQHSVEQTADGRTLMHIEAKFRNKLKLAEMSPREERWATIAGRVGYAARGLTFGLIGSFLIQAALHANPDQARGLDGALKALANQPYGPWLLGLTAAGLVAYGAYMFVEGRYRRIAV